MIQQVVHVSFVFLQENTLDTNSSCQHCIIKDLAFQSMLVNSGSPSPLGLSSSLETMLHGSVLQEHLHLELPQVKVFTTKSCDFRWHTMWAHYQSREDSITSQTTTQTKFQECIPCESRSYNCKSRERLAHERVEHESPFTEIQILHFVIILVFV